MYTKAVTPTNTEHCYLGSIISNQESPLFQHEVNTIVDGVQKNKKKSVDSDNGVEIEKSFIALFSTALHRYEPIRLIVFFRILSHSLEV